MIISTIALGAVLLVCIRYVYALLEIFPGRYEVGISREHLELVSRNVFIEKVRSFSFSEIQYIGFKKISGLCKIEIETKKRTVEWAVFLADTDVQEISNLIKEHG